MANPLTMRWNDAIDLDAIGAHASSSPVELYAAHPIPADKGHIRVFDLAHGVSDEPLQGRLRVVNLEDRPQYAALSYVWGVDAASPTRSIRCDNCDLKITLNCWMALLSLRKQFGAQILWIDSICINQMNGEEKFGQVPQMGGIYSSAAKTFLWLGSGNDATDETTRSTLQCAASWVLKPKAHAELLSSRASDHRRRKAELFLYVYLLGCMNSYRQAFKLLREAQRHLGRALGYRHDELPAAMALSHLLETEWLQRSWTFQELLLSSSPYVVWGTVSMDWLDFIRGVFHLRTSLGVIGAAPSWLTLLSLWNKMPRPNALPGHTTLLGPGGHSFRSRADAYSGVSEFSMMYMWAYIMLVVLSTYGLPVMVHQLAARLIPVGSVGLILDNMLFAGLLSVNVLLFLSTTAIHTTWTGLSLYTGGAEHGELFMDNKDSSQNDVGSRQLFEIVHALHERQATDPRDKVLALCGILDRLGFDLPRCPYSSSVPELYHQWYVTMLRQTPQALNMLLSAGSAIDGPSWVPDWRTVSRRRWLPPTVAFDPFAVRTTARPIQFELVGKELGVYVRFLGRIQDVLSQESLMEGNAQWKLQACTHLLIWFYKWRIKHPDYLARHPMDNDPRLPPPWTASFRTERAVRLKPLTTMIPWIEQKPEIEQHLDAMYKQFRSRVPDPETVRHHLVRHPQIYDAVFRQLTMNTAMNYNEGFVYTLRKLVVFNLDTFRGTTHGFASPETVVGDTIAIIAGVSTPLILRSTGGDESNRYKVVGQAFADELTYPCTMFNQSIQGLSMLSLV